MRPDNFLTKLEKIEKEYQLVKNNRQKGIHGPDREGVRLHGGTREGLRRAPSILKIEEAQAFLVVHRQPGRPGYMGGINAELAPAVNVGFYCHMDPGDSSSTSSSARAEEEEFHVQQKQGAVGISHSSRKRKSTEEAEECDYSRLGSFP
ncbi:hypothetical protein HAZT_HAZT011768 [Hyalella azteca]|uniref:Uncharacterized protein n=1 Tax=Hyalella azteca TaxID=294128 RepID=A0A6A0H6F6_HYAAZ|nr:hypothetical protein HAZT_HAZT011768 [Hyalella azteca]